MELCESKWGELQLVLGVKDCPRRRVVDLSARSRFLVVSNDVKHQGMTVEQESLAEHSSEARISRMLTITTPGYDG